MLEALKTSIWKNRYDITADGEGVATWDPSLWLSGGTLTIGGHAYRVRVAILGSTYEMEGDDGQPIASARRVGRKTWTIEVGGTPYEFHRASFWGQEQELRSGGVRVGYVKKKSFWGGDVVAELPGMPLPAQVFALVVVLTMWARAASAAAGAAGGAAAGTAASS